MEIVFVEHYDSFSYNVIEWIRGHLPQHWAITTVFCDDRQSLARLGANPKPFVLSPGPGHPQSYPETLALVRRALGKVPIFGICLGHQILGAVGGASIIRSAEPFHGSSRKFITTGPLFGIDVKNPPPVAVYHSLVIDRATLEPPWRILGNDTLGEIAVIEWPGTLECSGHGRLGGSSLWPAVGLQFHPESYLSLQSEYLIQGWLNRDVIPWHQETVTNRTRNRLAQPKNQKT